MSSIQAFVRVVGDATDPEDESLPGWYEHEVILTKDCPIEAMSTAEKAEIVEAVLDSFHDHQGIECLEDFTITVYLADGKALEQQDQEVAIDVVESVEHLGKVDESELPGTLRPDEHTAVGQRPRE